MDTFRQEGDLYRYENKSISLMPRRASTILLLKTFLYGSVDSKVDAVERLPAPISRHVEIMLSFLLARAQNERILAAIAKRLGVGVWPVSLQALERTLTRVESIGLLARTELSTALFRRGKTQPLRTLVTDAKKLNEEDLRTVVLITALRSVDMAVWPVDVAKRLAGSKDGDTLATRILLAHGLPEGLSTVRSKLAGTDDDREGAVNMLGAVTAPIARVLLESTVRSDRSVFVRLLCAEYLGADLDSDERIRLVRLSMKENSPVVRLKAVRQLRWLSAAQGSALAGEWLGTEPDSFIRSEINRAKH